MQGAINLLYLARERRGKKKVVKANLKNIIYNEKRVTEDPKLQENGNFDFPTSSHKIRFNEF